MFRLFKKKKELELPYRYAVIQYTKASLRSGVFHDFLKEIAVYEGNKISEVIPFTDSIVEAYMEDMPVIDRARDVKPEPLGIDVIDYPSEITYEVPEDYEEDL